MKAVIVFLGIFVMLLYPAAALSSMEIKAMESARIESGANADTNYGSNYQLRVGRYTSPVMRSLIKFNISALNALTIQKVELKLYSIGGEDTPDIAVYSVTSEWNESTVTWNNAPAAGAMITNRTVPETGFVLFDVTDYVKSHEGVLSFLLKVMNEAEQENYRIFLSDENIFYAPELAVTYYGHEPYITEVKAPDEVSEGDLVNISFAANDTDNDIVLYRIFIDGINVSDSSHYLWQTDYESSGSHKVKLFVEDASGLNSSMELTISVKDVKNIVINEFSPLANWIELYNPSNESIDVDGCRIVDGSSNIILNGLFKNNTYVLIQNIPGIAESFYLECNNILIDGVNQRDMQSPNASQSLGRRQNGYDTDSSSDFVLFDEPTPGSPNQYYDEVDTNHDGCISLNELLNFVEIWKHSPDMGLADLLEVVERWKQSPVC